ncbi:MAG: hypothetical protein IPN58_04585 [Anaerolineales bacterium]|nr:hypothetical protein [Anaerolineales bacterium]
MNFLKRFSLFESLLIAVILGTHLYASFSDAYNFPNNWFTRDDAYYYFKVAQNITQGLGSTFDGINLSNGYHPLWMIVCIPIFALARFDLILPLRVLLVVMALFNAATAVLIYRLVKENLSLSAAYLAASFWAFNLNIHATVYETGLETPLAAFTIVLFIYKLSQFEKEWQPKGAKPVTAHQISLLALIAVMVMFSRLDLVFIAILGGLWIILRGSPVRFLAPLDMVIIFISMTFSVAIRTGLDTYNSTYAASAVEVTLIAMGIKLSALYFFGAYQHPRTNPVWKTIRQTLSALTIATVLIASVYLILSNLGIGKNFPRSAFLLDWGISAILILAVRLAAHWFGNEKIKIELQQPTPMTEFRSNWKNWFSEALIYYGIVGGALALYMLYNKLTFGTSSPVSGQIKRWWGLLKNTVYDYPASNWPSFFGINYQWVYDAWKPASNLLIPVAKLLRPIYPGADTLDERYYIAMLFFSIVILILLFANARQTLRAFSNMALIPLIAGCGLQIFSYTTTAYGGAKEWYWASEMILIVLIGSLLFHLVLRPITKKIKNTRRIFEFASLALCVSLAYTHTTYIAAIMRHNYYPESQSYMEVATYIEENTPPGAIIGMTGGGNVGYFIRDRTIVNMDGLINSHEYFQALQNGEASQFLSERGMTIVFANTRLLKQPPYFGQFDPYLESYTVYGGKGLLYLWPEPKYPQQK